MATRFLIAFLLIASGLQAQVFQTNNTPYKFRGVKADSMLITAKGCDTAYLSNPKWGTSTAGALYVDTCNTRFYFHNGVKWNQVSGGTAAGCDSCYYATVPLSDSTGFVNITLDGRRDTVQFTGGGALINNAKVDSVTTVGDSLYYWVNGSSTYIGSLAASIVNGDTTIFDFIVDTTNVAPFQIPYADTTGYFKGDTALTWQPSDKTLVTDNLYLYGTTIGKAANLWFKIPSPSGGYRPRIYAGVLPTDVANGAIYFSGGGSNAVMEINSGDNNQLLLHSPDGEMLFKQTDGLYRFYNVPNETSYNKMLVINDSGFVAWKAPADTTGLGSLFIRNQFATQENKAFNIRSGRLDSLYASGSGGVHFATNGGASAFEYGAGGGTQVTFNGFAGYNANRAASYTARSFTDKGYVDSIKNTIPTVTSYGKNTSGDSTVLLLSNGQRFAAKDSTGSGGGGITIDSVAVRRIPQGSFTHYVGFNSGPNSTGTSGGNVTTDVANAGGNMLMGQNAGASLRTTGRLDGNLMLFGNNAGRWVTNNAFSIGFGTESLGGLNTVIADSLYNSGASISAHLAFGYRALGKIKGAHDASHLAIGDRALENFTNTSNFNPNLAIGPFAARATTTGSGIVAIGAIAVAGNTTGINRTAVGAAALQAGNGSEDVGVGYAAGGGGSYSGTHNTLLGSRSGVNLTSGSYNFLGGQNTGSGLTTGSYNVGIGTGIYTQAAIPATTGNFNLALMGESQAATTGSYNLAIGYGIKSLSLTGSNQLAIGSNSIRWIISDVSGSARRWTINGSTSDITATEPSAALEVRSTTGGVLMPRMTATQGSAISSPADGLIIYVTNTNATFTSIGFWGRENGAWVKL